MKRKDRHCRRDPEDGRELSNFLEPAHPGFDAIKMNNQDLHDEQADHQDDHSLDAVHTKQKQHQEWREDGSRATQVLHRPTARMRTSVGSNSGM